MQDRRQQRSVGVDPLSDGEPAEGSQWRLKQRRPHKGSARKLPGEHRRSRLYLSEMEVQESGAKAKGEQVRRAERTIHLPTAVPLYQCSDSVARRLERSKRKENTAVETVGEN